MELWLRDNGQIKPDIKYATHYACDTKTYYNLTHNLQKFWFNYCTELALNSSPNICEVISEKSSVPLSFNLKLNFPRTQACSTQEFVSRLDISIDSYVSECVKLIQHFLSLDYEVSSTQCEYIACQLKPTVLNWSSSHIEYVGRVLFPYAFVGKEFLSFLHSRFIKRLTELGLVSVLEHEPENSTEQIWTLPDHNLSPLFNPSHLSLHRVIGTNNTIYSASDVFDPRHHSALTPEILSERESDFWLPLMFSVDYYREPLVAMNGTVVVTEELKIENVALQTLEGCYNLLNVISPNRGANYWSWIDIGLAIHSINQLKDGLDLWRWFTSLSGRRDVDDCNAEWYKFESIHSTTTDTLEFFASQDNPAEYARLNSVVRDNLLNSAILHKEHKHIAKAFHAFYPHKFLYSTTEETWYIFDGIRWRRMNGIIDLMLHLNESFTEILEDKNSNLAMQMARPGPRERMFLLRTQIEDCTDLIKALANNTFKQKICLELSLYYRKDEFGTLKNVFKEYTATPTGVIDLRGGKPTVRPGKPEDYITKITKVGYPHHFTWQSPEVIFFLKYLGQVIRNKAVFNFFLFFLSYMLMGGNLRRLFMIFTGSGANSKSILVRIIEYCMGLYSAKLPTTMITGKKGQADSPTPVLIYAQGAKIGFLQEPGKDEIIKSEMVKGIVGGVDTCIGRDLFQKGKDMVEMDVTFVPAMITNDIPKVLDCQSAIWDRIGVVEFNGKWKDDAPEDELEQMRTGIFKLDPYFYQNIPKMAPVILWLGVNKYNDYYKFGLTLPMEVRAATDRFRVSNNHYMCFIGKYTTTHFPGGKPDKSMSITVDKLFILFCKWFTEQKFKTRPPDKQEFVKSMSDILGAVDEEEKWYGIVPNAASENFKF